MRAKAETAIILIMLAAIGTVTGVFLSISSTDKYAKEETPTGETPAKEVQTSNFTRLISMGQNICEGCHLSGKKFIPQAYAIKQHAEGGAYCLRCHKINHEVHPINDNVTCERCHGKLPQMPQYSNGTIVCAECHDYPDPMKASNGNLVVIHRPRNVDCTRCHTDSCLTCHSEIKSDGKWEKRLDHFRALMRDVR